MPDYLQSVMNRASSEPSLFIETPNRASGPLSERMEEFLSRFPEREEVVRSISLERLPAFMTVEWLDKNLSPTSPAVLKRLFPILKRPPQIAPFVVPPSRPQTRVQFCEFVRDLMHCPYLVIWLNLQVRNVARRGQTRQHLFMPVIERVSSHLPDTVDLYGDDYAVPGILVEKGEIELLREWTVVMMMGRRTVDQFVRGLEKHRDCLGDVAAFVRRMRVFMENDTLFEDHGSLTLLDSFGEPYPQKSEEDEAEDSDLFPNCKMIPSVIDREAEPALPRFVSADWIADKIALSGSVKSRLAKAGDTLDAIAREAGFWPQKGLEKQKLLDKLVASCERPFVLAAVAHLVLCEHTGRAQSLFRPFYRRIEAVARSVVESEASEIRLTVGNDMDDSTLLQILIEGGQIELARDFAFLRGCELMDENLLPHLAGEPSLSEVFRFLAAMRLRRSAYLTDRPEIFEQLEQRAYSELLVTRHPDQAEEELDRIVLETLEDLEADEREESTRTYSRKKDQGAGGDPPGSGGSEMAIEADGYCDAGADEGRGEALGGRHDETDQIAAKDIERLRDDFSADLDGVASLIAELRASTDRPEIPLVTRLHDTALRMLRIAEAIEAATPRVLDAAPFHARLKDAAKALLDIAESYGSAPTLSPIPAVEAIDAAKLGAVEDALTALEAAVAVAGTALGEIETLYGQLDAEKTIKGRLGIQGEIARMGDALAGHIEEGRAAFDRAALAVEAAGTPAAADGPVQNVEESVAREADDRARAQAEDQYVHALHDTEAQDAEAQDAEAQDAEAQGAEAQGAEAQDAEAQDAEAQGVEACDAEVPGDECRDGHSRHAGPIMADDACPPAAQADIEDDADADEVEPLDQAEIAAFDALRLSGRESEAGDGAGEPAAEISRRDARIDVINRQLRDFMASGAFGLAYHLAIAAHETFDGEGEEGGKSALRFAWGADEIRFATLAGRCNHAAFRAEPHRLAVIQENAFAEIEAVEDEEDAIVHRLVALPAAVETALLHPSSGMVDLVSTLSFQGHPLAERVSSVIAAVQEIAHKRLELSPSIFRAVANNIASRDGLDQCRRIIEEHVHVFSSSTWPIQHATKTRDWILHQTELGRLKGSLDKSDKDLEAIARECRDRFMTHGLAKAILRRADNELPGRHRSLQGPIRDRMITMLTEISRVCAEFVDQHETIQNIDAHRRSRIASHVETLRRELTRLREACVGVAEGGRELTGAIRFVADRLGRLDEILSGEAGDVTSLDHAIALHGDMPLIGAFEFGSSWYPAEIDPSDQVAVLTDLELPLLPARGEERDEAYRALFDERVERRSLVAAKLLVELAPYHGISPKVREAMGTGLEDDIEVARSELREQIETTRTRIDKIERQGAVGRPEYAEETLSTIEREEPSLPVDISLHDRIDTVLERLTDRSNEAAYDGAQIGRAAPIEDVYTAMQRLQAIEDEAAALLDEPRARLMERIARLRDLNPPIRGETIDRLNELCGKDELMTAEEYVTTVEETGNIPDQRDRMARFRTFSEEVLQSLSSVKQRIEQEAEAAIADGQVFHGLDFGRLSPARREEADGVFKHWREIMRLSETTNDPNGFAAKATSFIQALGLDASLREVTRGPLKRPIIDVDMELERDEEAMLLPDFGTLTGGSWRVTFAKTMLPETNLTRICDGANGRGVLLFVADVVDANRRAQFLKANIAESRRVILVDAASLLFALSEETMRPLTLVELGQPYCWAAPFKDWDKSDVPVEMFVGRRYELSRLADPQGACVVYGGRRLGKTALLRYLRKAKHDPDSGMIVAFVDVNGVGSLNEPPKRIWAMIAAELKDIFGKSRPEEGRAVVDKIRDWLERNHGARIVLLIDEVDKFIKADAAEDYAQFVLLHELMVRTERRFKFVLSGNSNVTRMVQAGNDPLGAMNTDALRIGPLMNKEIKDAEDLILKPFAMLGIRFERREDIWRILSYAYYYPVLVQIYGQYLLEEVQKEIITTARRVPTITSELVRRVLDSRVVQQNVRDKFMLTLEIDIRYELIAYVVAHLVMRNEDAGILQTGVSIGEIRDEALYYWPAGFTEARRQSLFEALCDEMEGLGILRRTSTGRWTLRSVAVTRLLGTQDEIDNKLADFYMRSPKVEFDPKSDRRSRKGEALLAMPITFGQEREILVNDRSFVKIVAGTEAADIGLVSEALRAAPHELADGVRLDVDARIRQKLSDMSDAIFDRQRKGRDRDGVRVVVVDQGSPWKPDWIRQALQMRPVLSGDVRVVFVANPGHVEALLRDEAMVRLLAEEEQVRVYPLEPWSQAFFERRIGELGGVPADRIGAELRDRILDATGLWNGPLGHLFEELKSDRTFSRMEVRLRKLPAAPSPERRHEFGISAPLWSVCRLLVDDDHRKTFGDSDIEAALDFVAGEKPWANAKALRMHGMMLGVFEAAPTQKGTDQARYRLAAVPVRMLAAAAVEAAA